MNQHNEDRYYAIPSVFRSEFKLWMHIVFVILIVFMWGVVVLPLDGLEVAVLKILFAFLGLFFLAGWLYTGMLKKAHIELTENVLRVKTMFSSKQIPWSEIESIQEYRQSYASYIGVISKDHKFGNGIFMAGLGRLLNGNYALTIPMGSFPKLNSDKLSETIMKMAAEHRVDSADFGQSIQSVKEVTQPEKGVKRPVLILLVVTIICGLVYGAFNEITGSNLFAIPLLGFYLQILIFYGSYRKATVSFPIRLFFGAVCALQALIAPVLHDLLYYSFYIKDYGFFRSTLKCVSYLILYPSTYSVYYLVAALLLVIGTSIGSPSRLRRHIRKFFLRKQNGHYVVKEGKSLAVYLIDYDAYQLTSKQLLQLAPESCLMESEGKTIYALYLPTEPFERCAIFPNGLDLTQIGGKTYYRLFSGGHTDPRPFPYHITMILGEDKSLEKLVLSHFG